MPALIEGYANAIRPKFQANNYKCDGDISLTRANQGNSDLVIHCSALGSGHGIEALVRENADIAMLSRPIKNEERVSIRTSGIKGLSFQVQEHVLALDGVKIIVPSSSTFRSLSIAEIADRFANPGRYGLYLYIRNEESGTRDTFNSLVMKPEQKSLPACNDDRVRRCYESSQDLIDAVANDPNGIGFVGYAYGNDRNDIRALEINNTCGIQPQIISKFNIQTEDYPLARRLFLYTGKVHSYHSPNFIMYAMSDNAQKIIDEAGFVDQRINVQSHDDSRERIRHYQNNLPREPGLDNNPRYVQKLGRDILQARRMSISFRFNFGSTMLDTKAWQDVHKLADYMVFEDNTSQILLTGFADSSGSFNQNVQLSAARAKVVKDALVAIGISPDRITDRGYGEVLPISCNNSENGREKNRRVEVWLQN